VKNRNLFKPSFFFSICLTAGILGMPRIAAAIHFPEIATLLKDYQVHSGIAGKPGKPTNLFQWLNGDSISLNLEWADSKLISTRYEQTREFDPDTFAVRVAEYGGGGAWHEFGGRSSDSVARKIYPGLEQQWLLKGYGGESGWLGTGLNRGRYFLVFRQTIPGTMAFVSEPLRVGTGLFKTLDTSSEWLHIPCPEAEKEKQALCFSPIEDSKLVIKIEQRSPLKLDIWLREPASPSLSEIRRVLESLPDNAQSDYAQELADMLLGESQSFMVKLSQRLPPLFNWPSWQLQDHKAGKITAKALKEIVNRTRPLGDSLVAYHFEDKDGFKMKIALYFRGTLHMQLEDRIHP
jgi:hypothetical protein